MDRRPSIEQGNAVRDVFISYSHSDVGAAQILAELLEANGLSVWWDRRLIAGDRFHALIERELEMAKAVIVLWSTNSVKSDWVLGEAQTAHELNKLIPLRIDECKLPLPYRGIHTPDVYRSSAELEQLARLLTLKLRAGAPSRSEPDEVNFSTTSSANFLKKFGDQFALAMAESDQNYSVLIWYNPISWMVWFWREIAWYGKHWKVALFVFFILGILSVIISIALGKTVNPILLGMFIGVCFWIIGAIGSIFEKIKKFKIGR